MKSLGDRLQQGTFELERLGRVRRETDSPLFGFDLECLIIARELRELEEDMLRDPGPLEPYLMRSRRWHRDDG